MAEGDIYVTQDGESWVVTIERIDGTAISYASREEAVEAGRRAAGMARSNLIILDASGVPRSARSLTETQTA